MAFIHLDSLLFNTPKNDLINLRHQLSAAIPEIFDYQIGYCMRIGKVVDTAFVNSITQYREDPMIQKLEAEIAQKFTNLSNYKETITVGLKRLKAIVPNAKIPSHIVFQNSLFSSSAFCTEKEIGVGLDQYLGKDSPIIKQLPPEPFYDWIKEGYDQQYLERDAILSWILTHILPETKGNLAELMIYHGKAIYLTEACLSEKDKNIIIRYSKEDLKWAKENEYSLWKYLVDEKLLFKVDDLNSMNLLQEGPFTSGLPEKGPDRLGQYLGWIMVKNYMENTKTSFTDLITTPYNEILQNYKPN
ncbi:MAG: hypothetical protein M9916_03940 [Crocinitomicaceae bacterium]|nr:hypothetical protein [Crocinitomicaceae bacterium]